MSIIVYSRTGNMPRKNDKNDYRAKNQRGKLAQIFYVQRELLATGEKAAAVLAVTRRAAMTFMVDNFKIGKVTRDGLYFSRIR